MANPTLHRPTYSTHANIEREVDPSDQPTVPLDEWDQTLDQNPPSMRHGHCIDEKYEILEPIGQGGMSTVFRAFDLRLKRDVAIKIMHPATVDDVRRWESFAQEAQNMARLQHPNVIAIYDVGRSENSSYLVMPYHPGTDLLTWVSAHGGPPVAVETALHLLVQVCDGIHALHEHGVVHGDIKPSNILVSSSLEVMVADLGMARHIAQSDASTCIGGTPGFIAPELITRHGTAEYAHKADVYGLAVTAYWLLTGAMPTQGGNAVNVLAQQLNPQVINPSTRRPQLPTAFDVPLMQALNPHPHARPDALVFRDALTDAANTNRSTPIHRRPLVVIVDDDPNALMLIEEIVRCAIPRAELASYRDPVEAAQWLRDRHPALIITDLEMPTLGGADFITAVRSRPQTRSTPIIVLTGVGSADDWKQLSSLGADRFMVKPIAEDMLHDLVLRAVAAPTLRRI